MNVHSTHYHRQAYFRSLFATFAMSCFAVTLVGCGGSEPSVIVPDTSPSAQEQLQADTALLTEEIDEGR